MKESSDGTRTSFVQTRLGVVVAADVPGFCRRLRVVPAMGDAPIGIFAQSRLGNRHGGGTCRRFRSPQCADAYGCVCVNQFRTAASSTCRSAATNGAGRGATPRGSRN